MRHTTCRHDEAKMTTIYPRFDFMDVVNKSLGVKDADRGVHGHEQEQFIVDAVGLMGSVA